VTTDNFKTTFVSTLPDLKDRVRRWRQAGETTALVPTMGALHEGHLSLVKTGKAHCDRLITSIFVNPTQFAPHEDFASYPRLLKADLDKLSAADCDLVWAPAVAQMYPDGFATNIVPQGVAEGLEADFRPQFFAGIATVCCKLFMQTQPDLAVFGEKDYQQLCVIRQLVSDLNLPLEIVAGPTMREADGLAMSSRNAYLNAEERRIAVALHDVLKETAHAFRIGTLAADACQAATAALQQAGFRQVDYVAIRHAGTLKQVERFSEEPCRVLAAAWLGTTTLIDNIAC